MAASEARGRGDEEVVELVKADGGQRIADVVLFLGTLPQNVVPG